MPKVNFRIDGLTIMALLAVAVALLAWRNRNAFNPVSDQNIFYQGTNAAFGEENVSGFFDHLFAARELAIDWLYPGDYQASAYARQVWGLE